MFSNGIAIGKSILHLLYCLILHTDDVVTKPVCAKYTHREKLSKVAVELQPEHYKLCCFTQHIAFVLHHPSRYTFLRVTLIKQQL